VRAGGARTRLPAKRPARPAKEARDRRSQQADDGAVLEGLSFRRRQQVAAEPATATFRGYRQPFQAGDGNLQRTELHHAVGKVDVGNDAAGSLQEESVAWFVEGIVQRRFESDDGEVWEDWGKELEDRFVIAAAGRNNGTPHAAGAPLPVARFAQTRRRNRRTHSRESLPRPFHALSKKRCQRENHATGR
jgi:hypothetical protein